MLWNNKSVSVKHVELTYKLQSKRVNILDLIKGRAWILLNVLSSFLIWPFQGGTSVVVPYCYLF